MNDYTTRITTSRNKIYQLLNKLDKLKSLSEIDNYYKRAPIYEMLANEYRELAKTLEDMEKKGVKE